MPETPLVSIVMATLNAADALAVSLDSIRRQGGVRFEWLVADGGSRDGTLELLRRHEGLIARWTSAPDAGIYDAWNKVCALARGEWLLFLGAGDEFAAPDTLARLVPHLERAHPAHDLVYGRLIYVSPAGRREVAQAGAPWHELDGRWEFGRPALPPHAAIFHHRSLFSGGQRFDTRFRIAGDTHFLLRYALRKPPLHVPIPIVRTPTGGASMSPRNATALAREIAQINRELSLTPPLRHRIARGLVLAAKVAAARMPAPVGARLADLYRSTLARGKGGRER